jgi:NTP pyrophosphatase (non-canonical NTP hydrolase)
VDQWVSQFKEGYFHPLTNMARLSEEVGELAREVNHRFGEKTKKKEEAEGDLAMEMADILFVLICMANRGRVPPGAVSGASQARPVGVAALVTESAG